MTTIGLTGGIATGKSTVGEILAERELVLSDADELSHRALEPGTEVYDRVVEEFGEGILSVDSTIDRARLAEMVFHEPTRLQRLEDLVHPWVKQRQREQIARGERQDKPVVLMIPLLFEEDLDEMCDVTWTVTCDRELQYRRLEERGLTRDQSDDRIEQQLPEAVKTRRADYVLYNNGTLAELSEQVDWCWEATVLRTD